MSDEGFWQLRSNSMVLQLNFSQLQLCFYDHHAACLSCVSTRTLRVLVLFKPSPLCYKLILLSRLSLHRPSIILRPFRFTLLSRGTVILLPHTRLDLIFCTISASQAVVSPKDLNRKHVSAIIEQGRGGNLTSSAAIEFSSTFAIGSKFMGFYVCDQYCLPASTSQIPHRLHSWRELRASRRWQEETVVMAYGCRC